MRMKSTKLDLQAFINSLDEPGDNDHPTKIFFQNRGIQHTSIAKALGVSPSLISKVMSGKTEASDIVDINLRSLAMISEKFEIYGVAT
jgi:hypothetical protein